ncbi:MAG: FtsQ-type POTRA domain-containing protein [Trueperaceae bacterium]|nr:FtsQ-type POTRA domain-containing protein [Trueperaceae bacterium]
MASLVALTPPTRRRALLAAALLLALLAGTRVTPTVERIEVVGADHHAPADVARLARIAHGDPLLWITAWRVDDLVRDPWIAAAHVERRWPDAVRITVEERTPFARNGTAMNAVVWAEDGTVLPDVAALERADLPVVRGWGPPRREEAFALLRLLRNEDPKVIEYAPMGFTIALADLHVRTPDLEALRREWAAVRAAGSGRVAIYPWGVSVADE